MSGKGEEESRLGSRLARQRPGLPRAAHICAFLSIHIPWLDSRGQSPCPFTGDSSLLHSARGGPRILPGSASCQTSAEGMQKAMSSEPSGAWPAWACTVRGRTSGCCLAWAPPSLLPAGPQATISQLLQLQYLPISPSSFSRTRVRHKLLFVFTGAGELHVHCELTSLPVRCHL